MTASHATLKITAGPNAGDTVSIELGTCRLLGRHLSETETTFYDRDGNRVLDGQAAGILKKYLVDRGEEDTQSEDEMPAFSSNTFDRSSDIILSDDSISRAHAMVFYDESGVGIIDLASTNGTYVNDKRVGSAQLRDRDTVSLGGSDLTVVVRS